MFLQQGNHVDHTPGKQWKKVSCKKYQSETQEYFIKIIIEKYKILLNLINIFSQILQITTAVMTIKVKSFFSELIY